MAERTYRYAFGGFALESSLVLPELTRPLHSPPVIRVERGAEVAQSDSDHDWLPGSPEGDWQRVARLSRGFLLRFVEFADFVATDAGVRVHAVRSADPATVRHLLLDHALPSYLGWVGHAALHASGVRTADDRLIVFTGESGRGKSTLAASLADACRGEVVADDCVVLAREGPEIFGTGTYPGLRLWPDSLDALLPTEPATLPVATYSVKRRVARTSARAQAGALPVAAIFSLERDDGIALESFRLLSADEACRVLVRQLFQAGHDPRRSLRLVAQAAEIARSVPVCALDYPRSYDGLARITDAILANVGRRPSQP